MDQEWIYVNKTELHTCTRSECFEVLSALLMMIILLFLAVIASPFKIFQNGGKNLPVNIT